MNKSLFSIFWYADFWQDFVDDKAKSRSNTCRIARLFNAVSGKRLTKRRAQKDTEQALKECLTYLVNCAIIGLSYFPCILGHELFGETALKIKDGRILLWIMRKLKNMSGALILKQV